MAFLLGCESVSLEHPTKKIFDNVTVGINEGDRIGIVGRNGDGKSSLLALLTKVYEPDSGQITRRGGLDIGVLGQADNLDDNATVANQVVGDTPEYIWAGDARTRSVIDSLLGDIDWNGLIGSLSGGQRRRVDLARVLIEPHDVLMLDEPTNHLDVIAITWLADHLKNRWGAKSGALLTVSHDRWFLDEVCTTMWEVHDRVVDQFEGGYSAYILQRVERAQTAATMENKRQNLMRRELAWLSRGAQARSSKPKFHVDAARELIAGEPPTRNTLELKATATSRLGKKVVDMIDVTKAYKKGDGVKTILDNVTWLIGPGDRLGLLGSNGAGKSTILNLIQGKVTPDSGRVTIGKTVKFAVLSQRLDELEEYGKASVRDVLKDYKQSIIIDGKETTSTQLLERLDFDSRQLQTRVCDLSGGQKRRLQLMLILLDEPNVLILDEPGNDLDTDMLAEMEGLLDGWPGTLILVSHDRFLMEHVTDDQYALIDGHLTHCPGGVDDYIDRISHGSHSSSNAIAVASDSPKPQEKPGNALTNNEERALKKQLATNEKKVIKLREKSDTILARQHDTDPSDFVTLGELQEELQSIKDEIDELELEWLEISEKLGL